MERRQRPGLRAKVVIASVVVLALSTLISVLAVRQILLTQLRSDIDRSLIKEIGEFQSVLDGNDPNTGEPFGSDLASVFDTYLSQNIPSEGEETLTIVDGRPYRWERAHDAGLPLESFAEDIRRWSASGSTERGELSTPAGELIYIAEQVTMPDGTSGALVIANAPEFERSEIADVTRTMASVGIGVIAIGSILSWLAAGRVVAPISELTHTARSISDSDLSRRIEVRGNDEVSRLAQTFNDMLDRLDHAFVSQREFVDDAGHELRTPITIVRGHLELMGERSIRS